MARLACLVHPQRGHEAKQVASLAVRRQLSRALGQVSLDVRLQ